MRTVEEIRSRWLLELENMIRRPCMYGRDAFDIEGIMRHRISELCLIDDRDEDWRAAHEELGRRDLFRSQGVAGRIRDRFGEGRDCICVVASVYAALAYRLGYLSVDSVVSSVEFRRLRNGLRALCRGRDWRKGEVIERFGPPSLSIGGTVLVYAARETSAGWISFDFDFSSTRYPDVDYLLRNVRLPARHFTRECTLTPHGRRLRVGTVHTIR